ncbi:MAG: tRNA uridine(34) 5-carboxymethylaminomethyl modification radical SAM/GNAT enzyme Elp3, partial [Candidatus Eisenbacteria sp.]|nr:tRNA uridine(34) 5-carboxymethylaminomethyl modification radical SAM/GNAT enzyme Elp3 [Candidatus Eisenbacteria bacterium]
MLEKVCREIIETALVEDLGRVEFDNLKIRASKKHGFGRIPKSSEILSFATEDERKILKELIVRKPSRSISGVSVVAV